MLVRCKRPVERGPLHAQEVGHTLYPLTLVEELLGVALLLHGQLGLTVELHPALLRGLHASVGAHGDQAVLYFGQHPNHLLHGAACGGLGIDVLGQGAQLDPLGTALVQHRDEIAQAAA